MLNSNSEISIVMSTYNGEKYLKQSIESILSQTFRDFEFLIIDDGSTDNSWQILQDYAKKDSRVKVFRNEQNLGLTKSLNRGLSRAKGEYIARMDDDDISLPTRLEKQFQFMEQNPSVVLCGVRVLVIDQAGEEIGRKNLPLKHKDIKNKLLFNNQFIHSSLFFKNDLGIYNEKFARAQDYEFVLRVASRHQVVNLPEYLVKWRARQGSLSFSGVKQQKCAIKARYWAITKYGYPKALGILHIILRTIWLLIPKSIARWLVLNTNKPVGI